jgi:hypothetical protein
MAERRVPLGDAIPKMTYRIQAFVFVVGLVQQLLDLIDHEAARQLATSGKPIPGPRSNCPPVPAEDQNPPATSARFIGNGLSGRHERTSVACVPAYTDLIYIR